MTFSDLEKRKLHIRIANIFDTIVKIDNQRNLLENYKY